MQIMMHDRIFRTLDAWYVPELLKKLISFGALDKRGYIYTTDKGQIKVSKRVMVVMKGKLYHGIYHLLRKTVVVILQLLLL